MLPEPASGFTASFQNLHRVPQGRALIESHFFMSSNTQDDHVVVNSSNTYAQSFILDESVTTKFMDVFISRNSGVSTLIDIRVLADSGGQPDTVTVLGACALFGTINKRPKWFRFQFDSAISLNSSTKYWIEISCSGDTELKWYLNSSATGLDIAHNTFSVDNDRALVFKLLSTAPEENYYSIPNILSWGINASDRLGNDYAELLLANSDSLYNETQPLRHLLSQGRQVRIQIGFLGTYLTLKTLLIDSFITSSSSCSIKLLGKSSKLISQEVLFKSSYIGMDYGDVLSDLMHQAGLISGTQIYADASLDADAGYFSDSSSASIGKTGLSFPSGGTLEGTIANAVSKIEQAINYVFYFDPDGLPVLKPRRDTFNSQANLSQSRDILRSKLSVNESKKNLFNRIIVHNGKTSDNEDLLYNTGTSVATYSGTIESNERLIYLELSYSTTPVVRSFVRDLNTDGTTQIEEISRSTDSITVEVRNLNYPNSIGNYNFEISGSVVSNDSVDLILLEKTKPWSIKNEGLIDLTIKNNLFTSVNGMNKFADRTLLLNSNPREFFDVPTRGNPLIENGDIISFNHSKINSSFIYQVTSQAITYRNDPRQYLTTYTCERYPFLDGESINMIYLYSDDSHVADDDLYADSEAVSDQLVYV